MDHVIAPLDADHRRAASDLAGDLCAALGIEVAAVLRPPHLTIASYDDLPPEAATRALSRAVRDAEPLDVRAHGYGVFTGPAASDLSLHVMVVRTAGLDALHRRVHTALVRAGARMDGLTRPDVWTPHITLLGRQLDPARLGRAVTLLADRPHRSWSVHIDELHVGPGGAADGPAAVVHLGP